MLNPENTLILVKGEDKTSSILSWSFDPYKPVVFITYNNRKSYPYNTNDVKFFHAPKNIPVADKLVLRNGLPQNDAEIIQIFNPYCRILYKTSRAEICMRQDIRIISSALNDPKSRNCFQYLKNIATAIGLIVEGRNILATHYDEIDFIREDSVLASFLNREKRIGKENAGDGNTAKANVYPFGFNLSQRQAIDNALISDISIIEGPPGTGKTQTILNITANAVMRGESVAIVSGNNAAIANVFEKLNRYGVGFIVAQLGNCKNKSDFIAGQSTYLPDMSSWESPIQQEQLSSLLSEFDEKLKLKNELAKLIAEKETVEKERIHYTDYYNTLHIESPMPIFSAKTTAKQILAFASEYEYLLSKNKNIGFFKKLSMRLEYGLKKLNFIGKPIESVIAYCHKLYYDRRIMELSKRCSALESALKEFEFDRRMKEYSDISMEVFRLSLAKKFKSHRRQIYTKYDLRTKAEQFLMDYPVILSTAYSLRSSLSSQCFFDYVIVDEASQVDLVTGALALSCARKAVIVGDLKQLPNVVNQEQKQITDRIFETFNLSDIYRYSNHSLLSSMIRLFPEAPHVLLKEHYRCHPEIIGFCNQRFYNNELVILTALKTDRQPMIAYKTAAGNMARGHVNERQIEVIKNEVFSQQNLNANNGSVGIVTPYRNQADRLQQEFSGTTVKADTVDKFQGQERNVMIFSTVDNQIGEFASDPNRLNVAVSRAIDQFIVVTDGNENDKVSPIHELLGYIQYHNHDIVNSDIHSVFDYLYAVNAEAREKILRKYRRESEFDSENLMLALIRKILKDDRFSKFGVVVHVPLRSLLCDLKRLNPRELSFATNHLTHVDFLIFSRLTHQPVLVIEVDGFAYHNSQKQKERDLVKDSILNKFDIPILRLNTVGSCERERITDQLTSIATMT